MGTTKKQTKDVRERNRMETLEFIDVLLWYIKSSQQTTREFIKAQNEINEIFNARYKEIREREEKEPK